MMPNSSRTILSVGQCRPDQAAITHFLTSHFDTQVVTADLPEDALKTLRDQAVDLVLINRKLDADYSDGLEILRQIRSDTHLAAIPVMLVSNFPEWQQVAVEQGAVYGFGKAELNRPETRERIAAVLNV